MKQQSHRSHGGLNKVHGTQRLTRPTLTLAVLLRPYQGSLFVFQRRHTSLLLLSARFTLCHEFAMLAPCSASDSQTSVNSPRNGSSSYRILCDTTTDLLDLVEPYRRRKRIYRTNRLLTKVTDACCPHGPQHRQESNLPYLSYRFHITLSLQLKSMPKARPRARGGIARSLECVQGYNLENICVPR